MRWLEGWRSGDYAVSLASRTTAREPFRLVAMNDLHAAAKRCLDATDPAEKQRLTHATWQALQARELALDSHASPPEPIGARGAFMADTVGEASG